MSTHSSSRVTICIGIGLAKSGIEHTQTVYTVVVCIIKFCGKISISIYTVDHLWDCYTCYHLPHNIIFYQPLIPTLSVNIKRFHTLFKLVVLHSVPLLPCFPVTESHIVRQTDEAASCFVLFWQLFCVHTSVCFRITGNSIGSHISQSLHGRDNSGDGKMTCCLF